MSEAAPTHPRTTPLRIAWCGPDGPAPRRLAALGHAVTRVGPDPAAGAIPIRTLAEDAASARHGFDAVVVLADADLDPQGPLAALMDAVPCLLVLTGDPGPPDAAHKPLARALHGTEEAASALDWMASRAAGVALPDSRLLDRARAACPGPVEVWPATGDGDALLPLLIASMEARPLIEAAQAPGRDLARWGAAPDDPAAVRLAALWDALFGLGDPPDAPAGTF